MRTFNDAVTNQQDQWIGEAESDTSKYNGRLIIINKQKGVIHLCRALNGEKTSGRMMTIEVASGSVFVGTSTVCKKCKGLNVEGVAYAQDYEQKYI